MSTEQAASQGAKSTSVELQNAGGSPASDGANVEAQSSEQPSPDAEQGKDRQTPEHRTAKYRFGEMSRQIRDLELELAKREGMLAALNRSQAFGQGPQNAPAPEPAPQAPAAPVPPNPADFAEGQYDAKFLEALADYRAEVKVRSILDENAKRSAEQQQKELDRQAFAAKAQRFQAVYDEAQKVGARGAAQVFELVDQNDRAAADLLMNVNHPVETADWLADNQDWLRAIAQTRDPLQKALLVGRIDQHVSYHLAQSRAQASAQTTQGQTAAPNPTSVSATSVAQPTVKTGSGGRPFNPSSAEFAAYEAWRKANPNA